MVEIRQTSSVEWKAILAAKGSKQEQDIFQREVDNYRSGIAKRIQSLSAEYKSKYGKDYYTPEYQAAKAAIHAEAEAQLLAWGFLHVPDEAKIESEFLNNVFEAIVDKPLLVLKIITRIVNFYRSQRGKADLTEAQVKTRMLS